MSDEPSVPEKQPNSKSSPAAKKKASAKAKGRKRPAAAKKGGSSTARRPYPTLTLSKALSVPQGIKQFNGGNPWATEEVAKAVGMGARSSNFFYLTAAARDFGLTSGTRETESIALADLGREIVYAPDPQTELQKKVEAFLRVDIFKRVLDHYKGSSLPEMKYLGNTLEREFGLAPEFHEDFSRLFRENCEELNITSGGTPVSEGAPQSRPATVIVGQPKGDVKKKPKAFIIMPFTERGDQRPTGFFAEVLRNLLTPAGVDAGFVVETANRQGSDVIQSTIINDLLDADLVIADLTDHNPNVLFELGMRMAQDKPVALVKATGTGRIFDVDNMLRVYEYNANLWHSTITKDLPEITNHIKGAWDARETNYSYIKILRRGVTGQQ